MSQHQETQTDDNYLNDFHRQWNEACLKEIEEMHKTPFTPERLKAQVERMERLVREQREQSRRKK